MLTRMATAMIAIRGRVSSKPVAAHTASKKRFPKEKFHRLRPLSETRDGREIGHATHAHKETSLLLRLRETIWVTAEITRSASASFRSG